MDEAVKVVWWMCFLVLIIVLISSSEGARTEEETDENPSERKHFNFASHQAGAIILDKSVGQNGKGFHHLLNDDRDKYGISPCTDMKWIVISLSEEISITSIVLANFEKYSSMVQDFQLFGSVSYPTSEWTDLGTYTAALQQGEQTFNITSAKDAHIRYLKMKVISHYEVESLCTLSQIKVYGITVFASLHQEVQRSRSDDLKHLLQEQESWQEVADLVDETVDTANITEAEPERSTVDEHHEAALPAVEDYHIVPEQIVTADTVIRQEGDFTGTQDAVQPATSTEAEANNAANASTDEQLVPDTGVTTAIGVMDTDSVSVSAVHAHDHKKVDVETNPADVSVVVDMTAAAEATEPVVEDTNSQRVALVNEVGDTEEVQVNASDWESFNQALKDTNQTADSFVGIFKRFIDPISKTLDIRTLQKYIFSQPRTPPSSSDSSTTTPTTAAESAVTSHVHNITIEVDNSASSLPIVPAIIADEIASLPSEQQQQQQQQVVEPVPQQSAVETALPATAERDSKVIAYPDMDNFKELIPSVAPSSVATTATNSNIDKSADDAFAAAASAQTAPKPNEEQQPILQITVQQPEVAVEAHTKAAETPPPKSVVEVPKHDVPDAQTQLNMNLPPANISNTAVNSSNINGNISAQNGSARPANKTTKLTINCLEQLRFPEFQAKMIAKLQTNKNGSNGEENIANNKDNVFKQMMNRIKSLETNQLITEVYIAQTTDCFRVIKEQLIDGKKPEGHPDGHLDLPPDSASTTTDSLLNLSITNGLSSSSSRSSNTNATNKQRAPGPNRQKNTSVMGLLSLTFSRLMFAKDEEEKLVALRYFVEFIRENAVDFWMTVCILLLSSVILFATSVVMICCILMGKRKR